MAAWDNPARMEERAARRRLVEAGELLQAAERGVRRRLVLVVVQVLVTVAVAVWLVVDPRWLTAVALLCWVSAVWLAVSKDLPLKRDLVGVRRRGLGEAQFEYDVAHARMLEAERQ